MTGELIEFAAERQKCFDASTSPCARKESGHFGTPAAIAAFMAGMFSHTRRRTLRVLDPGAGVGTLSAAICQRALKHSSTCCLEFELYENDPKLVPLLTATMGLCKKRLGDAGHQLRFVIRVEDFILTNTKHSIFDAAPKASFNLAILNPPYFKLRKESQHARVMEHVVHGQPNIYALFMALAGDMLLPGGELVAITPRSYFNGPYFKRFRKWFFDRLAVRQIHLFDSRSEAFKDDGVLQENVIIHAQRNGEPRDVLLTTSFGRNLTNLVRNQVGYGTIIDKSNDDHVIRVSSNRLERDVIEAMDSLPRRFRELGLEISTGPVVTFRSTEFLRNDRGQDTAPLLWMHNVRPFVTQFPNRNGKPTHIVVCDASKRLLVAAKTYVLLKRFTAKEEKRRIVAGIMNGSDSYSEWVGLENHLNYVYRRNSDLSEVEALGIAAYFNSAFVDRYFRAISGSTQVNATEIRGMPVPEEQTLSRIGEEMVSIEIGDRGVVERIVGRAVGLPGALIHQLVEAAQ